MQQMDVWSRVALATAERHKAMAPTTSNDNSPGWVRSQLRLCLDIYLSWMPHLSSEPLSIIGSGRADIATRLS
jgi:hypothetical protein